MKKSTEPVESSLIFVCGQQPDCVTRFITIYQEGIVIDAAFSRQAYLLNKEWELGAEGAVRMVVVEKDRWQEVMIEYNLSKGYLRIAAVTARFLSPSILAAIARQFFIRSGKTMHFLSSDAIAADTSTPAERFLTIRIPAF